MPEDTSAQNELLSFLKQRTNKLHIQIDRITL